MISFVTGQRTHEIGVGMALAGVVPPAWRRRWACRILMVSQLFGVTAQDPLTFALVAAVLDGIALPASYFPARRAARLDPMIALRLE